jgi:hypothetical protein
MTLSLRAKPVRVRQIEYCDCTGVVVNTTSTQ